MSNNGLNITNVELKNAVYSKVSEVESIASCMAIDYSYNSREWKPICDTMMDVCHGIVNNTSMFVACNTPNSTNDGKIYAFTSSGQELTLLHVTGHSFFKVLIYENAIIAITVDGKIVMIDDIDKTINNDSLQFIDFPEKVVDATIISNKLWILSPTKLYQISGRFDEIIPTEAYPDGLNMQGIIPAIGGNDIIFYANTDQLPMFTRYNIIEKKFTVFSSSTPFTIVNAILIGTINPTLYVYSSDAKVRVLTLSDNIGFFDFNMYSGYQWVGECSYYDGFVYNQFLDLTTGSPKLFLARSMNGIIFQIVTEDFDYYDDIYGKYCQGDGQSIFISPTCYRIKTPHICGIDYSRYNDLIELRDVHCEECIDESTIKFDVSDSELAMMLIDEASFFVNFKVNGRAMTSVKINKIIRDESIPNGMHIIVKVDNFNIMTVEDTSTITADFIVKRIW